MRCTSLERGCRWTGTIGTLDDHKANCQFALVLCPKCEDDKGAGELHLTRKDLDNHLKTKCPKRAYECQHCGEKGTYATITEDHDKVCNRKIVPCPNNGRGCLLSNERGESEQHVRSFCDYTEVACAYESLGCGVRMLRKDITKHQENDDKVHLHLSLRTLCLREEQHKTLSQGEAVIFKLSGYASKKEKNTTFFSDPFYTSSGGYKMHINVDANGYGDGKGTHITVSTALLKGRYDDQLHWPFLGTVTCELLNQLADDKHHSIVVIYNDNDDMQVGRNIGYIKFFPHSSLLCDPATNTQYLLDDTLYFRVSVNLNNHKPWLVCTDKINMDSTRTIKNNKTLESILFKIPNCDIWKQTSDSAFFSDSFYTSPGGYRMCITIIPSGLGSGKGNYISVYATHLDGPCDNDLPPTFTGVVTVHLLNQLDDKNHYTKTLECSNLKVGKISGYPQFISYSTLFHDPVKNMQYLKNNTLYFKVTVKVANKKPWLVCTHHT